MMNKKYEVKKIKAGDIWKAECIMDTKIFLVVAVNGNVINCLNLKKQKTTPYDIEMSTEGGVSCAANPAMISYKMEKDFLERVDGVPEEVLEQIRDVIFEKLCLGDEKNAWYEGWE